MLAYSRLARVLAFACAGVALSRGAGGGVSSPPEPVRVAGCENAVCESAIRYTGEVQVSSPGEVLTLSITLCHQAVCATRRPAQILDTDAFDCGVSGLLEATCTLRPLQSSPSRYELAVAFAGPGEDYQAGDSFSVRVEGATSGPQSWSGTATSYRDERPAGEGCPPLCRYASLN